MRCACERTRVALANAVPSIVLANDLHSFDGFVAIIFIHLQNDHCCSANVTRKLEIDSNGSRVTNVRVFVSSHSPILVASVFSPAEANNTLMIFLRNVVDNRFYRKEIHNTDTTIAAAAIYNNDNNAHEWVHQHTSHWDERWKEPRKKRQRLWCIYLFYNSIRCLSIMIIVNFIYLLYRLTN